MITSAVDLAREDAVPCDETSGTQMEICTCAVCRSVC